MGLGKVARIAWGASFANLLYMPTPLDAPIDRPRPRDGSETRESAAGDRDSYLVGVEQVLEATVRWIPINDTASPTRTGWNGATGWRAFLEWAWQANAWRFYPDVVGAPGSFLTCYLIAPLDGGGIEREPHPFYRRISLVMRTIDDSDFTGY